MDLEQQASIAHWFSSMEAFWETPLTERERKLRVEVLGAFAVEAGMTPDELIDDVMSGPEGGSSAPKVAKYWKAIRRFGDPAERIGKSYLISFFVHNGVLMQAPFDA